MKYLKIIYYRKLKKNLNHSYYNYFLFLFMYYIHFNFKKILT